jgi:hypothetical protein
LISSGIRTIRRHHGFNVMALRDSETKIYEMENSFFAVSIYFSKISHLNAYMKIKKKIFICLLNKKNVWTIDPNICIFL